MGRISNPTANFFQNGRVDIPVLPVKWELHGLLSEFHKCLGGEIFATLCLRQQTPRNTLIDRLRIVR